MTKSLKINERLEKYISDHSYDLHPVQKEILIHNESLGLSKKMQISVTQAYFFQFFIRTNNIKNILEVGTFTGYSALSMGLAIPKDGNITCLDINKETSESARIFFKKANLDKKIKIILAPAAQTLSKLKDEKKSFDMIFIDADKENYKNYYNQSLDLIEKNGLIIVDNVLWHGEVANTKNQDKLTTIIRDFNSYINKDKRTENLIIPIGDGLTVCRKL